MIFYRGWIVKDNRAKKGHTTLVNESEEDMKRWIDQIEFEEAQRRIKEAQDE